jgi:hypothetical protein
MLAARGDFHRPATGRAGGFGPRSQYLEMNNMQERKVLVHNKIRR